jgi:endo-1,4-beta-mannosidase
MDRRDFITKGVSSAIAGSLLAESTLSVTGQPMASLRTTTTSAVPSPHADIRSLRFGVNYTPSNNWWFCWNDWNTGPIERDLDAIASLGADHLRILLIWPYFQPNPKWVSPAHLDRMDQLLDLMASRKLDAVITAFTGQLSGLFFLPPFNAQAAGFYSSPAMWHAQELFIRELARIIAPHPNVIGFDFGNELNTCWRADTAVGDAWMAKMFALMDSLCPAGIHVNGADHVPWFEPTTFSPQALASRPLPVIHCYPYWANALKYGGPMDPPSTKLMAAMATLVRSYSGDAHRPVWAEEFNTCIESLTSRQEAEWLETTVAAAMDSGVSWFTYWDSHDVDRRFGFSPMEYNLGLLTNQGKLKEQGKMFKRIAEYYRGRPVTFPTAAPPPPPIESSKDLSWKWMLDWMEWKPKNA